MLCLLKDIAFVLLLCGHVYTCVDVHGMFGLMVFCTKLLETLYFDNAQFLQLCIEAYMNIVHIPQFIHSLYSLFYVQRPIVHCT